MNEPYNKYDLLGQVLNGESLQKFIDGVMAAEYNKIQWKKYFKWDTMRTSTKFDAMEAQIDLVPMASLISMNSPKPKRATQGFELYSGKIPKMGHAYDLDEEDLRNMLVLAERGGENDINEVMDLFYNTARKLLMGIHTRFNFMTFQGMSTGKIVINTDNNPDGGVLHTVDLRVPTANKKYSGFNNGTSAVWTDPTATPLTDLKDWVEWAEDNFKPSDIIRMDKSLWRTFSTHPNVIKDVRAYFANTNLSGGEVAMSQLRAYMNEIGIPPIEIVDSKSGVEIDGVVNPIVGWDTSNMAMCAAGPVGLIKNARPIMVTDPSKRTATSEGGRIKVVEKSDDSLVTKGLEAECLGIPILAAATSYSIFDTSTTASW